MNHCMRRSRGPISRGSMSRGLVFGIVLAFVPGVVLAGGSAGPDGRRGIAPIAFFAGPVAVRPLGDRELDQLRGTSLEAASCSEHATKRRVVLWDEARSAEVAVPGAESGNQVTTSGAGRPGDLFR